MTPRDTQDAQQRMYSAIAGVYGTILWMMGYERAVRRAIALLPFTADQPLTILDAGSGTGLFTFALLDTFPRAHVTACDANQAMLDQMRTHAQKKGVGDRLTLVMGDVAKPLAGIREDYDLIVTGGVLEYLVPEQAVRNLSHYLKKGGYFLNSPVRNIVLGRLVGKGYHFTPHARETNIRAFTDNGYALQSTMKMVLVREVHIFRKD